MGELIIHMVTLIISPAKSRLTLLGSTEHWGPNDADAQYQQDIRFVLTTEKGLRFG
jgi:hypothetical protein